MIAAIDWGQLGELVWAAALAGGAVGLFAALAIRGSVRAGELRRSGRAGAAAANAALAVVAGGVLAALVVFGIVVTVAK